MMGIRARLHEHRHLWPRSPLGLAFRGAPEGLPKAVWQSLRLLRLISQAVIAAFFTLLAVQGAMLYGWSGGAILGRLLPLLDPSVA